MKPLENRGLLGDLYAWMLPYLKHGLSVTLSQPKGVRASKQITKDLRSQIKPFVITNHVSQQLANVSINKDESVLKLLHLTE